MGKKNLEALKPNVSGQQSMAENRTDEEEEEEGGPRSRFGRLVNLRQL